MNAVVEAVENPFRHSPIATVPSHEAFAATGAAREVAEVQASMMIARRFPRVEVEVMDMILQACTRPSLAEGALYEFARGGSDVRGPSIRLAEMLAQKWGHLDFGWRTLEERPGVTKVQCFAWDLQTGVRSQRVFDVTHERSTRQGTRNLSDPRDIYEHVANAAARRLRACILNVIPGDVVEAAQKQCERTLAIKVEVTPERLKNLVTQFDAIGVTQKMIEKRTQRRLDAMTPGLMHQLGKIYTSILDGMSTPASWFDMTPEDAPAAPAEAAGAPAAPAGPQSARAAVRERLQARRTRAAGSPDEPPPSPPVDAYDPGPVPDEPAAAAPSAQLQDVVKIARAAMTQADVAALRTMATQLTDEDEVTIAQQHIDAARRRVGG